MNRELHEHGAYLVASDRMKRHDPGLGEHERPAARGAARQLPGDLAH